MRQTVEELDLHDMKVIGTGIGFRVCRGDGCGIIGGWNRPGCFGAIRGICDGGKLKTCGFCSSNSTILVGYGIMTSLKPDECVQKVLLSTRSRLVGEYNQADDPALLVTHAWLRGPEMSRMLANSAFSQSFYVASFRTEPVPDDHPSIVLPDYSYFGEFLAVHLSILYGKHFQSHGLLESSGYFRVPEKLDLGPTSLFSLSPFNHAARLCVPTELNLCEISRIRPVLDASMTESGPGRILFTAGRFYNRALCEMEELPELAYLDLVTCGEIISGGCEVANDRLYDDDLKELLLRVERGSPDGSELARMIRGRLYQVRRRFAAALSGLLDEYFFAHPESKYPPAVLRQGEIDGILKAAYDLRSRYVHTGVQFGAWVRPHTHLQEEIMLGAPVMDDNELKKILVKAPSLCGMERIMRYCLLKIAKEAGATVADLCS